MDLEELAPEQLVFLAGQISLHDKAKETSSLNDVMDIVAMSIVAPLADAACVSDDPSRAISYLVEMSDDDILSDLACYVLESNMPVDEKAQVLNNIGDYRDDIVATFESYMQYKAADFAEQDDEGKNIVSGWLYDILKLRKSDGDGKIEKVRRGMINAFRSSKAYIKKQLSLHDGMRKNIKSINDISSWYSRYTLGPAIDIARDGYVSELASMCAVQDVQIMLECAQIANEFGIEASPEDFDAKKVRQSMRQFCRARTGYYNPFVFFMSILPDAEVAKLRNQVQKDWQRIKSTV